MFVSNAVENVFLLLAFDLAFCHKVVTLLSPIQDLIGRTVEVKEEPSKKASAAIHKLVVTFETTPLPEGTVRNIFLDYVPPSLRRFSFSFFFFCPPCSTSPLPLLLITICSNFVSTQTPSSGQRHPATLWDFPLCCVCR